MKVALKIYPYLYPIFPNFDKVIDFSDYYDDLSNASTLEEMFKVAKKIGEKIVELIREKHDAVYVILPLVSPLMMFVLGYYLRMVIYVEVENVYYTDNKIVDVKFLFVEEKDARINLIPL